MKIFSSRRRVIAFVAFVLLLLFVLRPGVSRLKSRIVTSISAAVGRPVEVGSVRLRILPRPGFDLHDLVVYDDPAFSAEPILRCSEVSAALRVTSLLRGHLEIARLNLTEPSLNLVHAPQGGWNLEALVERSSRIPLAPTAKAISERRSGFPYIEGTSARINFKNGAEKKPYALTNADFALWQDSENTWGVRLKAQPFRSDFNLNDTGIVQLNGTWQRASLVRDTPLQISLEWSRAQLGQVTKFFLGNDRGWRGAVQLDVTLAGTPANLKVTSSASVEDFRRYDSVRGSALKLAASCDGQYSSPDHIFHGLDCVAPVGDGRITLRGDIGFAGSHNFDLTLHAENVPAISVAALARRAKKKLPDDLTADGTINGNLSIRENAAAGSKFRFEGRGEISDFQLASASNKVEIGPETLPFVLTAVDTGGTPEKSHHKNAAGMPGGPRVEFGPFPITIGRGVVARGWFGRPGYNIALSGDAEIGKTLRLARMVGLPALQTTAEGSVLLDLRIAGSWDGWSYGSSPGFAGPQVTGTAKLRNVQVALRGTSSPIEILSGQMRLLPDSTRIEKLNVKAADSQWTGSLELPRGCGTPDACLARFNLNADEISWSKLANWINPRPAERPWYRMLESSVQPQPSLLASLHATGRISSDRFEMLRAAAAHVIANLRLDHGKIGISQLTADMLGGKLSGEWQADVNLKAGICGGSGNLTGISLARFAETMKDEQFTGTASAAYELKGPCSTEFWHLAEGTVRFNANNSVLPRISLADDFSPLRITQIAGEAKLHAGQFAIENATIDSDSGRFQLSGTAGLNGDLELKLSRPTNPSRPGFFITGTLTEPHVEPTPSLEQARLKTEPTK